MSTLFKYVFHLYIQSWKQDFSYSVIILVTLLFQGKVYTDYILDPTSLCPSDIDQWNINFTGSTQELKLLQLQGQP